jgi:lipopolysaccharide export system protein LptA
MDWRGDSRAGWRVARGSSRVGGLVLAAVVGALGIGALAWFGVQGKGRPRGASAGFEDAGPAPEIGEVTDVRSGRMPGQFRQGGGLHMEFADREDPTRVAMVITSESAELKEARTYEMVRPLARQFGRDGKTLHFSADRGRAYIPGEDRGGRPETATLTGNAKLEVYEPKRGPGGVDPGVDRPVFVGTTDRIEYNGALGEVLVPGRLEVSSAQVTGSIEDVAMRFSETSQRLEHLRAKRSQGLTFTPVKKEPVKKEKAAAITPETAPLGPGSEAGVAPSPAASSTTPRVPVVSLYKVRADRGVVATQGGRKIISDDMEVWIRLVDNRLSPGAIASLGGGGLGGSGLGEAPREGAVVLPLIPMVVSRALAHAEPSTLTRGASIPERGDESLSEPLTLTWNGELEITPVEEGAWPFAGDEVAVRFGADAGGWVTFSDAKSGATAQGQAMQYRATTRRGEVLGGVGGAGSSTGLVASGGGSRPARLFLPGTGEAVADAFAVDLATGAASASGAGFVRAVEKPTPAADESAFFREPGVRRVSWETGSEFRFAMEDGRFTPRILEARPRGGVVASDQSGEFRGDRVDAFFVSDGEDSGRAVVSRLVVAGHAQGKDAKGASLAGESLEVEFTPTGKGASDPARLRGRGAVVAAQGESILRADELEATLSRDAKGVIGADVVKARRGVRFGGRDGVRAEGDELVAYPREERVDLSGEGVLVGQRGTLLKGPSVRLDGKRGTVAVFGPGSITHEDAPGGSRLVAAWTRAMTFDDATGRGECVGGVHAEWEHFAKTPGENVPRLASAETADGERLLLELSPGVKGEKSWTVTGGGATPDEQPRRRLVRAEAVGELADTGQGTPARLESKRYAAGVHGAPGAPGRVERRLYLESARVLLEDEGEGSMALRTPGAGKLLVSDRREALIDGRDVDGRGSEAPGEAVLPRTIGDALFTWAGSMSMSQRERVVKMLTGVELVQRRGGAGFATQMRCAELEARLREDGRGEGQAAADSGELESALARGEVWFSHDSRELVADRASYQAREGELVAQSDEGREVTVMDPKAGSPMTGREIYWNLRTGRIEVRAPGTVVAPR